MDNKGIFLSFMIFLLITGVLALYNAANKAGSSREQATVQHSAFDTVNNAFNNMFEEVVNLKKAGFAREVQLRPMPFEYNLSDNRIFLKQVLPQRDTVLKSYLDALNIYSIFANQQQDSLRFSTKVVAQSEEWGSGTEPEFPDLNYLILPQCIFFDLNASGTMVLRAGLAGEQRCKQPFSYADLNSIDVNISFDSEQYAGSSIKCSGAFAGCPQQAFNPSNSDPFITVGLTEKCPLSGCKIITTGSPPYAFKTISAHFDPAAANGVVQIPATADYNVLIEIGKSSAEDSFPAHVENQFTDQPIVSSFDVVFDQKIEMFYFTGFDINVSKQNFPVTRST